MYNINDILFLSLDNRQNSRQLWQLLKNIGDYKIDFGKNYDQKCSYSSQISVKIVMWTKQLFRDKFLPPYPSAILHGLTLTDFSFQVWKFNSTSPTIRKADKKFPLMLYIIFSYIYVCIIAPLDVREGEHGKLSEWVAYIAG